MRYHTATTRRDAVSTLEREMAALGFQVTVKAQTGARIILELSGFDKTGQRAPIPKLPPLEKLCTHWDEIEIHTVPLMTGAASGGLYVTYFIACR